MSDDRMSHLTQSFLQLGTDELHAVPVLLRRLTDFVNSHVDDHHPTAGTVCTALACLTGEFIVSCGDDAEAIKKKFVAILDAYTRTGQDGARIGPSHEPSLVRRFRPWRGT
jgi:hypothetical protein